MECDVVDGRRPLLGVMWRLCLFSRNFQFLYLTRIKILFELVVASVVRFTLAKCRHRFARVVSWCGDGFADGKR